MSPSAARYDDAVVGAGLLGLAHAFHLARRGRKVIVFDRRGRAEGPSAHDSGGLWPIGQPAGPLRRMALRSREVWLEVLGVSRLRHERSGSLHLAYREDTAAVLREFAGRAGDEGFRCELLGPDEVARRSPLVRTEGLAAGLFSHWEVNVDPREVVAGLPVWLARERGVRFKYGREVVGFDAPTVRTTADAWTADRLWVCSGEALGTLYPDEAASLGLDRFTVRGLRTAPLPAWRRLGPILAGGPSLRHSPSFEGSPGLPALRARVARESPALDRLGVDLLVSQDGPGGLTIGSSHEPGDPDGRDEVDRLLLQQAHSVLDNVPAVTSRWQDTLTTHPTAPYCLVQPAPLVATVAGLGASEMTLSFGLAEVVVNLVLGGD